MQLQSAINAVFSAGLVLAALAPGAEAQERPAPSATERAGTITVVPGKQYEAGALKRAVLGSGWRDLWTTPVQAPVLDLETYAGGLTMLKRSGGFHSLVLHLQEENGWREYRFRSVDKFPKLPTELQGTLVGDLWNDQVSILFPAAPLIVHPLLASIGALHVEPELYVMGDSPRLREQRDSVTGLLATFELKGQEAPDDKPGFAGSEKIKGSENFIDDLASSRAHRLDEHEFLAVRLIDFLVNDVDRSRDNFDWARFGDKGAYTWRPIARDRDQAFVDARGLVNTLIVRRIFPKQVEFGNTIPVKGLTYTSHPLDRRLLQRLTADDFRTVALRVQRAVTDSVIDQVVALIPDEWRAQTAVDERVATALRARRQDLPAAAMEFYRDLATEVDVHATDDADRIDVVRHADGRVTVTITDPDRAPVVAARRADGSLVTTSDGAVMGADERGPFYSRTFIPGETNEVRLYAGGGDDVAMVRGAASGDIVVRLIGEKGDDVLTDSAGGGQTFLYDSEGSNRLVAAVGTKVSTRSWKAVPPETGFRPGGAWRPDWGGTKGLAPTFDYNTGAGLIVGVGQRMKKYGFRRLPHHWDAGASLLVGTGNGRLGVLVDADYRFENSPRALRLEGRATQLASTRFHGYGNVTPRLDRSASLVDQNEIVLEPSLAWLVGWRAREGVGNRFKGDNDTVTVPYSGLRPMIGEIRVGANFGWFDPQPGAGSPLQSTGVIGGADFGLAGARVGVELDRTDDDAVPTSGWNLEADVAGYPSFAAPAGGFGTADARGAVYLPLGRLGGPHVALRAGGSLAAGEYPAQFSAAIGGRRSVRGYSWRRYAGDAAMSGSAELRVPVGTVNFVVRSQLGVFALADAGRVWFDGASDGGWHSGVGGGFWLAAFGRSVSVAYARGESGRLYLSSGLFY